MFDSSEKQKSHYSIAFYNVENLFDTINDTTKFDEASPIMEMKMEYETIQKKS